jgi:hypothetical protein
MEAMFWLQNLKGRSGRPRHRCKDNIKMDLRGMVWIWIWLGTSSRLLWTHVMNLTDFGCAYTEIIFKFSRKPQTECLVLNHQPRKNVRAYLNSSDSTALPPKRSRKFSEKVHFAYKFLKEKFTIWNKLPSLNVSNDGM